MMKQGSLFGESGAADLAQGLEEEGAPEPNDKIAEPFDPEDIDVVTRTSSVDLLLSRARSGMLDLQPDFQRRWGVWDNRRQSRLIESLLLKIPLPVLYAAEDDNERWEIVDGIQRLSTIVRFIESDLIKEKRLVLSDLEYLTLYNGKGFADLPPRLQLRLRETELVTHLIRKGTPAEVKFNIFARINTGGMALSPQELRHAITPGPARIMLQQLAETQSFLRATDNSIRPIRMDDRELALRFSAFFLLGLREYSRPDMDAFLISAMKRLNSLAPIEFQALSGAFEQAMNAAWFVFGPDAFRKRFDLGSGRLPINKALFETVAVNLANLSENQIQILINRRQELHKKFIDLCRNRDFEAAISQGTGDVTKVNRRFNLVKALFEGASSHA